MTIRKFFIIFLFFAFGFYAKQAKAVISQTTLDVLDNVHTTYAFQKLGTGFTQSIEGIYSAFKEPNSCSNSYSTPFITLVECPDSNYTGCSTAVQFRSSTYGCNYYEIIYFQNGVAIQNLGDYGGGVGVVSAGEAPYQMLSDKYYYIYQKMDSPYYNYKTLNSYGAMAGQESWTPPVHAECDSFGTPCVYDYLYFIMLNTNDVIYSDNQSIRITPVKDSRLNGNLVNFTGTYSTNASFDELIIQIDKRSSPTVLTNYIDLIYYTTVGTNLNFEKDFFLPDGNYTYKTYLKNYSTGFTSYWDYIANSWDFVVGTSTKQINPIQDINEELYSTMCDNIATSTLTEWHLWGDIECGLKKVFAWAFYADQDSMDLVKEHYEELKGVFPFNAFFDLTDIITDVATSTATSTAGTISIPFISSTSSQYIMLPVISSSSLSNLIGVENNNLFRNSLGYFMWLVAGFMVFITVKYI
jgi:hypothetical protein